MVKLVVLYGPPADPDAFERHYADTPTELATVVPGPAAVRGSAWHRHPGWERPSLPAHRRAHLRRRGGPAGGPVVGRGSSRRQRHSELRHRWRHDLHCGDRRIAPARPSPATGEDN